AHIGDEAAAARDESAVLLGAPLAGDPAELVGTGHGALTLLESAVIASRAKQSRAAPATLDCRVGFASSQGRLWTGSIITGMLTRGGLAHPCRGELDRF